MNADSVMVTNLFAYCNDDPIGYCDNTGKAAVSRIVCSVVALPSSNVFDFLTAPPAINTSKEMPSPRFTSSPGTGSSSTSSLSYGSYDSSADIGDSTGDNLTSGTYFCGGILDCPYKTQRTQFMKTLDLLEYITYGSCRDHTECTVTKRYARLSGRCPNLDCRDNSEDLDQYVNHIEHINASTGRAFLQSSYYYGKNVIDGKLSNPLNEFTQAELDSLVNVKNAHPLSFIERWHTPGEYISD